MASHSSPKPRDLFIRKGQYQLTNCSRQSKAWYLLRYKPSRPRERWSAGSVPKKSWQKQQAFRLCSSSQGQSPASASFLTSRAVHTWLSARGVFSTALGSSLWNMADCSLGISLSQLRHFHSSLPVVFLSSWSLKYRPGLSHLLATTFLHSLNYVLSKILLFCIFCLLFWLIQKSPYYFILAKKLHKF